MQGTSTRVDEVRERVGARARGGGLELPVLSDAVRELLAKLGSDRADAASIAVLLRKDASICAHVFRVANSALYAPVSPIVSLQQAASRLGIEAIRKIALVVSCETRAFKVRGRDAWVRATFRRALHGGVFAQEIARARRSNVEEAFLAGLLHDVGRPLVLQAVVDEGRLPAEVEERLVDELHAEAGATLIARWGLPARIVEAARHHHDPSAAPDPTLSALVALADEVTTWAEAPSADVEQGLLASPYLGVLDLYPEDLAGILARRDRLVESTMGLP